MSEGPPIGILATMGSTEAVAALSGAMPDARLVSVGWRFGRAAGRSRAVSPAALDAWLAGKADRPATPQAMPAGPHPAAATALRLGATLIVCGLDPWVAAVPKLMARRPDLRVVALAAEPTACTWPEYVSPAAAATADDALAALAGGSALVVVPERGTAARMERAGRGARPLLVEPRPSCLAGAGSALPHLPPQPVMIAYGPIEARANTLLLLHLWRESLARGTGFPKLVLAGGRGRQVEEIAPLLDWNAALRPRVAEAPGLPPAALRRLIAGSHAVLVPDVATPPAELMRDLLALGVPVIAADTPAARDLGITPRLDPLDGPGWREAIAAAAAAARPPRPDPPAVLPDWPDYATRLLAAIRTLP